tara:strand:+ start:246 stop:569 length:324 start_codon:yes stop_codon:yes gene_type:complete
MLLAKMENFRMDLGSAYTGKDDKGHLQPNIKDQFVLNFAKNHNGFIYKVGVLGPISLYTYGSLPEAQIWIFKDENSKKLSFEYNNNDAEINIEKYLAELIMTVQKES